MIVKSLKTLNAQYSLFLTAMSKEIFTETLMHSYKIQKLKI